MHHFDHKFIPWMNWKVRESWNMWLKYRFSYMSAAVVNHIVNFYRKMIFFRWKLIWSNNCVEEIGCKTLAEKQNRKFGFSPLKKTQRSIARCKSTSLFSLDLYLYQSWLVVLASVDSLEKRPRKSEQFIVRFVFVWFMKYVRKEPLYSFLD